MNSTNQRVSAPRTLPSDPPRPFSKQSRGRIGKVNSPHAQNKGVYDNSASGEDFGHRLL